MQLPLKAFINIGFYIFQCDYLINVYMPTVDYKLYEDKE